MTALGALLGDHAVALGGHRDGGQFEVGRRVDELLHAHAEIERDQPVPGRVQHHAIVDELDVVGDKRRTEGCLEEGRGHPKRFNRLLLSVL